MVLGLAGQSVKRKAGFQAKKKGNVSIPLLELFRCGTEKLEAYYRTLFGLESLVMAGETEVTVLVADIEELLTRVALVVYSMAGIAFHFSAGKNCRYRSYRHERSCADSNVEVMFVDSNI